MTPLPADFLTAAGLNRQHVFAVTDLPAALCKPLALRPEERQLVLLGHGGKHLWQCVQAAGIDGPDPIDTYVTATVDRCFAQFLPGRHYRIIYPGPTAIGLQALGELAGWHFRSPFMVGVDPHWGSWHAYRAVVVADSDFLPDPPVDRTQLVSPCSRCAQRPCIPACPAGAAGEPFDLDACSAFRLRPGSPCAETCLARLACPVGHAQRYKIDQIRHSYRQSLAMLEKWQKLR